MITIAATGSTPVTVTLYEMCQNTTNPFFTWSIERKGSFDTIVFYQDDISSNPFYYNTFNITVATNSVGLTQGVIPAKSGEWVYTVYEMASPYILSTYSAVGIAEVGLLIVMENFITTPISYSATSSLPTIPVYRG